MKKYKVYVTQKIAREGIEILKKSVDVVIGRSEMAPSKAEIIIKLKNCDGMLSQFNDKIDSEIMESAPRLKVVSNHAVGYDNIDIKAATQRKIVVTNTPGILTETTADLAWALLMDAARRIAESDRFSRSGKWKFWRTDLMLGQDIHHATLGIIGMGRIGAAFAKRATGFSMQILYHNRTRNKQLEKELGAQYVSMDKLLKESDFISLHCPLTPDTRNLMGKQEFMKMKKSAIFINTSRGAVVDQKALYNALKSKQIYGAGLDVYEKEPVPYNDPLLKLENVVFTPHIGSASVKTRTQMAIMCATDIISTLKGKQPKYWINKF